MDIRVSFGSEAKLGLRKIRTLAPTETIYLLTRGICHASCEFCSQAKNSESSVLSRVRWNVWELDKILPLLKGRERVCIQCLNFPGIFDDLMEMVKKIKSPLSVSAQPFTLEEMHDLSKYVDRISISLDCLTKDLFSKYKSYYDWDLHWTRLKRAVEIFGRDNVISHVIVGLGETEREAVNTMQELFDIGAMPSLFAFTPIKGTKLENRPQPDLGTYRRLQIARCLLSKGSIMPEEITYDGGKISSFGDVLGEVDTRAFQTWGCPHCNRPYFNEVPGKTIYNYPNDIDQAKLPELISEAQLKDNDKW
ncbi:MAG TPA: radical SAM protein [Candidatus Methanofastidiosa archaeon]|nr:radical SAM protein [Candidatus Methanofastidiosa archaeon]